MDYLTSKSNRINRAMTKHFVHNNFGSHIFRIFTSNICIHWLLVQYTCTIYFRNLIK